MRLAWIVVIAACSKDAAKPDWTVESLIADMAAYGEKSLPMMAAFDGNCTALAEKLLTLEPLAKSIRARGEELEKDPARAAAAKERMRAGKAQMTAKYEALLKPLGATLADVDRKEAEIKAKCGSDPKFQDAEERVGLKKHAR